MANEAETMLVRQVANGDQAAFQHLLDTYFASINRYAVRMMGNTANAEDITQEVFLRLWTRATSYKPEASKLSTWLHNIAHNLCIDYFRKNNRFTQEITKQSSEEGTSQEVVSQFSLQIDQGGEEPDHEYATKVQQQNVKEALMTLSERQRSAIIMCHYQGISNKDAAKIMDISVDALESLLSRGRLKLRKLLTDNGND